MKYSQGREQGVVSLMVTIIMMLVITMIVLGFATVSRREQRQSLDRQLSEQAFLAAESGINLARAGIAEALNAGRDIPEKTECNNAGHTTDPSDPYHDLNGKVDDTRNVSYTCLLVSTKLDNISQTVHSEGASGVIRLNPIGGSLSRLHIQWGLSGDTMTADASNCAPNATNAKFSPRGSWQCPFGVLRVDMVPTDDLTRTDLQTDQHTYFFYPTKGGGNAAVSYADGNSRGTVQGMKCGSGVCKIDISNISGSTNYALRVSSVYADGKIVVSGDTAAPATALLFSGAQAKIDATGKAQDVLRRIQVRLSLDRTSNVPKNAIVSGSSICKRFGVTNSDFVNGQGSLVNDGTNPMCTPFTSSVTLLSAPSGPSGADAAIDTGCAVMTCDSSDVYDPGDAPKYRVLIVNQSKDINPGSIAGCRWNMGDGVVATHANKLLDASCQYTNSFNYDYQPVNPAWKTCQQVIDNNGKIGYQVYLTIYLKNGSSVVSDPKTVYAPPNCHDA